MAETVHAQGRPERPWALADFEALCKQEVKAEAKLEAAWLNVEGMPQHSHWTPQQRLGDIFGARHLRKSLSNH